MVIQYAENGSLRQLLNNSFNSMNWEKKLSILHRITFGIYDIHNKGLIHRDFHSSNILNGQKNHTFITDLGLCQPVNVKPSQKSIYGVLPYVAPEVLRGKEYTRESDIYGFGIVAHEVCTGLPPYHDIAHEEFLAVRICHGLRPNSNYEIPQLILDSIKQCWDVDPLKRPKAGELKKKFSDLYNNSDKEDSLINKQIKEADKINEKLSSYKNTTLSYKTNPQAVYTSRLLDFKDLPEPKNNYNYSGN
jgi:serine/threonine protein kinase